MDWQRVSGLLEQSAGVILVGGILLDIFLTVLYARLGTGVLSRFLARGLWKAYDGVARRLGRVGARLLPIAGPLILVTVIAVWVALLVMGFALMIHPGLGGAVAANG